MTSQVDIQIVNPHVSFRKLASYSIDQLNNFVIQQYPFFNLKGVQPKDFDPTALGPKNGVVLYEIFYKTTVPETGKTELVSGLVALPDTDSRLLPIVSYQHGTILSRDEVPSNTIDASGEVKSAETLFNIARFAGNGYALIAADYIGKGISQVDEAYMIKNATTQTNLAMLRASQEVMNALGYETNQLFLNGWSQGALNTQWYTYALEALNIPVSAMTAASPFNDLFTTFQRWSVDPSAPSWVSLAFDILLNSHQTYYDLEGLLSEAVNPDYLPLMEAFWKTYQFPLDPKGVPLPLPPADGVLVPNVGNIDQPPTPTIGEFLSFLKKNQTSTTPYQTPVRFYYGTADEVLPVDLVTGALTTSGATGIEINNADHRGTFLYSMFNDSEGPATSAGSILDWFDAKRSEPHTELTYVIENDSILVSGALFRSAGFDATVVNNRTDHPVTMLLSIEDASGARRSVGSVGATGIGFKQFTGDSDLLLHTGDRLIFSTIINGQEVVSPSDLSVVENSESFLVSFNNKDGADFEMLLTPKDSTENLYSSQDRMAALQTDWSSGLLNLKGGDVLNVEVITDSDFHNLMSFVRIDQDSTTHLPLYSVAGIEAGHPDFDQAIKDNLVTEFFYMQGGKNSNSLNWAVVEDGLYAPVVMTPTGSIFTFGSNTAVDGRAHMMLLGQNQFGFEDLLLSQHSDWDFNDVVMNISLISAV
jgi:pimeloyl-ACP methyl ester carboxylesterase